MAWFKLIIFSIGAYMSHSYYLFSDSHIEDFMNNHVALMASDPSAGCQDYSDKVEVDLNHTTMRGPFTITGGRGELCNYMSQGHHPVLGPDATDSTSKLSAMQVTSGFPWQSAVAEFDELAQMDVSTLGTIHSKTHETIQIERGLWGLKMVEVTSTGGVGF